MSIMNFFKNKKKEELNSTIDTILKTLQDHQVESLAEWMVKTDQEIKALKNSNLYLIRLIEAIQNFKILCECNNKATHFNIPDPRGRIDQNGNTKKGDFCDDCFNKYTQSTS